MWDINSTSGPNSIEISRINLNDDFGFLQSVNGNWNNHLPMLLLGLELLDLETKEAAVTKVIELGSGEGSTPLLRKYCESKGRLFQSFDNNQDWCNKTGSEFIEDWDNLITLLDATYAGLIFVDHAPGERRFKDTVRLGHSARILVLHDTEEGGAGDYKWDKAWPHFKYRLNYNKNGGGAGATAVSNTIDLNRFRGLSLGQFTFDND